MSYKDLRDFQAEHTYDSGDGLVVQVEKMGGGTLGKEYTGTWRYIVTNRRGEEVGYGQDYVTGMPHSHDEVARELADHYAYYMHPEDWENSDD